MPAAAEDIKGEGSMWGGWFDNLCGGWMKL